MDNFSNIAELLNEQLRKEINEINSKVFEKYFDKIRSNSVSDCIIDYYKDYKTDCYFFVEAMTMGGHICICRRRHGKCACKECKFYLSISEADKIIERIENVKEE